MSGSDGVIPEFRMSAFEALIGLRRYLRDHPSTAPEDAAISLKRSDADYAAADFDGALSLHAQFPDEIDFSDPTMSLRQGLSILITAHRPWWCRFFPYGRQRLATALTQDELQTFRSAGLLHETPPPDVVGWWDSLAAMIRAAEDEQRSAQGREAERLSLDHERARLEALGISEQPKWTALDDNSAGYDIQSYEKTPYGLKNLLIEVKSTQWTPPRMILTRSEWDKAVAYGDAYVFHVWELPAKKLTVLNVTDVGMHIPTDISHGRWTDLEIRFP